MSESTITAKGQITLPKAIRDYFHLEPGDRVEFLIGPDGTVTVWPVTADVRSLKGIIPKPKAPVSLEEMNEAIKRRGGRA